MFDVVHDGVQGIQVGVEKTRNKKAIFISNPTQGLHVSCDIKQAIGYAEAMRDLACLSVSLRVFSTKE